MVHAWKPNLEWLDTVYIDYIYIISHKDHLYALSGIGSVEVDDFPKKIRVLKPSFQENVTCVGSYPINKFSNLP